MVPPTPKRMVWRVTELLEGWSSSLCAVPARRWLILRSSVLTSSQYLISMGWMSRWRMLRSLGQCCLGKVGLLMVGGAAEVLLVSLTCPLPLLRTHPPPFIASLLFFCSYKDGSNQYSIRAAWGKPIFVWEAGWKEPLWCNPSLSCIRNLKILHSQPFAYIHAGKAGSYGACVADGLEDHAAC